VQAAAAAVRVARGVAVLAEEVANCVGVVGEPREVFVGRRQFLAAAALSQLGFEQLAKGGGSSAVADVLEVILEPRRRGVLPGAFKFLPEGVDLPGFAERQGAVGGVAGQWKSFAAWRQRS
jgi:hypothetical protein